MISKVNPVSKGPRALHERVYFVPMRGPTLRARPCLLKYINVTHIKRSFHYADIFENHLNPVMLVLIRKLSLSTLR